MFSITSGESCPRVKFRGLGRAAGNRSPGSSPQMEHRVVKIAYHFGLPGTQFPPLCRLGKEGGAPALPVDIQHSVGVQRNCTKHNPISCKACGILTVMEICIKSAQQSGLWRYKVLVPKDPQQNKQVYLCNIISNYKEHFSNL